MQNQLVGADAVGTPGGPAAAALSACGRSFRRQAPDALMRRRSKIMLGCAIQSGVGSMGGDVVVLAWPALVGGAGNSVSEVRDGLDYRGVAELPPEAADSD